jgi:hypothetical protein
MCFLVSVLFRHTERLLLKAVTFGGFSRAHLKIMGLYYFIYLLIRYSYIIFLLCAHRVWWSENEIVFVIDCSGVKFAASCFCHF